LGTTSLSAIHAHEVTEFRVVTVAIDRTDCIGPPIPSGRFDAEIEARGRKQSRWDEKISGVMDGLEPV